MNTTVKFSGYAVNKNTGAYRAVSPGDKINEQENFLLFKDGPPPAPTMTHEEILLAAIREQDKLLSLAAIRIAPLQDAAELGKATDDQALTLVKWKEYRIAVNDVKNQEGFPNELIWPEQPE